MEVVDDVPVINLRNGITVSEVPLDVVAEGLIGLLDDAAQIPSGFGAQAGCLVVLDEGTAEGLPIVDGAGRERPQPVESVAAHHDREVGGRDVVVAVRRSNGDGVGVQPRLGVRLPSYFSMPTGLKVVDHWMALSRLEKAEKPSRSLPGL